MLNDFEEKVNDISLYGAFIENAFNDSIIKMLDSNIIVVSYDIYEYFDDVVYPVFKRLVRNFLSEDRAREELYNILNNKLREVFDNSDYNPKEDNKTIIFSISNRNNLGFALDTDGLVELSINVIKKISSYKKVQSIVEALNRKS